MQERPLTVATYAAGASLAAIALVYVFGPTFLLDHDAAGTSKRGGAVGLTNYANDCFINSILQALAGLPELRKFLIREVHRRALDGDDVYAVRPDEVAAAARGAREVSAVKLASLRQGAVTQALKDVLDRLNERSISRRTISAHEFIGALERAFRSRISRQQQDAHEFLQLVTERLQEEYAAGAKARANARELQIPEIAAELEIGEEAGSGEEHRPCTSDENPKEVENPDDVVEDGFPFQGKLESRIECQTCGFTPKPAVSSFVIFTLNVPHTSITSLNHCFDGLFKVENIEDYKCDRCRLEHAIAVMEYELSRTDPESPQHDTLTSEIARLKDAVATDPENPPPDITLPDRKLAPKRRIQRHSQISHHPKVLALHLSRSIYTMSSSTKNLAKVSFPETLHLGPLLARKTYRLLALVTHKGGHNSGHYESFRRQLPAPVPFSTPLSLGAHGAYSRASSPAVSRAASPHASALASVAPSPRLAAVPSPTPASSKGTDPADPAASGIPLTPLSTSPAPGAARPQVTSFSSQSSASSGRSAASATAPTVRLVDDGAGTTRASTSARSGAGSRPGTSAAEEEGGKAARPASVRSARRVKRKESRWWRISDEKVKECKTNDVLGMQKEVYLLFYELVEE